MTVELVPITPAIGTEVRGVDLTENVSDADMDRIYHAWVDSTILLIRNQRMSPAQQVEVTARLGEVFTFTRSKFEHPDQPEILVLSNIARDGKPIGSAYSGRVWHSDGAYLDTPPAGSMLYALEVPPEGGDTCFANMFAAYDALPARIQERIDDLQVVISRVQSRPYNYPDRPAPTAQERSEWPDVAQPLVRVHPVNGRKALYPGGNVPWKIVGMADEESMPLITYLQEFAVLPRFTYCHHWQPGDVIVWDNRSAMHRATPYDQQRYRRLMHRTTIAGVRTTGREVAACAATTS